MARFKHVSKKMRLEKLGRLTKWAPFWTIPKSLGKGKRAHPARVTTTKRHWKRTSTKA